MLICIVTGSMCTQLYGKIFKNESKNITAFPRIPDVGQ